MASGLDDLLSGLPGFSKPSMKELKQQGRGTSSTPLQANAAASRSPAATGTASPLRPPQAPGTSPAAVPFGMDQLDHLVKSQSSPALAAQRASANSASSGSLGGLGSAGGRPTAAGGAAPPTPPEHSSAGAFDDLLGGLGGSARGGASMRSSGVPAAGQPVPAAAAAASAAAESDRSAQLTASALATGAAPSPAPLLPVDGPTGSPPVLDEDPFAMFGGPPPAALAAPLAGSSAAAVPVASPDDGFLDAFAAPPARQPEAATQQHYGAATPSSAAAAAAGHDPLDFGDFLGSDDREAPPPAPPASTTQAAPGSGSGPPVAPAGAAGPTSSFGYERRSAGTSGATQSRYRVFDYVDAEPDSSGPATGFAGAAGPRTAGPAAAGPTPARAPSTGPLEEGMRAGSAGSGSLSGSRAGSVHAADGFGPPARSSPGATGGGGALHADSYAHPAQNTKEVVAELSKKAATAFQSGTKWFMKASKNLVSQVQQRLDHQGHGQGGPSSGGGPPRRPGEPAPFHYDWAAQLSRVSPNSRSAALGAMAEEDRLAVQRVLDESTLGDSYMEGPGYEGYATPAGSRQQQQQGPAAAAQREGSRHGAGAPSPAGAAPRAGSLPAAGDAGTSRSSSLSSLGAGAGAAAAPPPAYDQLFGSHDAPLPAAQQQQQPQPQQAQQQVRPPQPPAPDEDLLGMDGRSGSGGSAASAHTAAGATPLAPAAAAAAAAATDADFLFGSADSSAPAGSAGTSHIDDLFTVPAAKPPAASGRSSGAAGAAQAGRVPGAAAAAATRRPASGLDSMIDLGGDLPSVDTAGFGQLYQDADADAGEGGDEPEVRRALRQKRIQEKHERMMRQLAEKRARDEAEAAEKSGKVELRSALKPKIDAWSAGKKDNIRALLASLHTVLWQDSGWTQPSMADMVEPGKVKRAYMKANLVVHPDKVKQKGGTLEQVATADMVFDVLKAAWGKFEASGRA
ncbi:hypothetical protein ABPG77_002343 [Micractinium sp. CCAP 211/92]